MTIDQDKLGELVGTFVTDLGATIAAGSVVVGHRLPGTTCRRRATT